jgi:hypothetical protein
MFQDAGIKVDYKLLLEKMVFNMETEGYKFNPCNLHHGAEP